MSCACFGFVEARLQLASQSLQFGHHSSRWRHPAAPGQWTDPASAETRDGLFFFFASHSREGFGMASGVERCHPQAKLCFCGKVRRGGLPVFSFPPQESSIFCCFLSSYLVFFLRFWDSSSCYGAHFLLFVASFISLSDLLRRVGGDTGGPVFALVAVR